MHIKSLFLPGRVRLWYSFVVSAALTTSSSAIDFDSDVRPILAQHCVRCHGPDEQNGMVRIDELSSDLVTHPVDAETWHDALNAINLGLMPPEDETPLTKAERSTLVDWMTTEIQRAIKSKRGRGGQVVMRRLNRVEYNNTMRDLLGLDIDYAKNLPADETSAEGFKNNGAALRMSAMQLEYYLQSARSALAQAIVEGDAPEVHRHQSTETVSDKVKDNWNNRLGRTGVFVARVGKFPDEGEFLIRVHARAEIPARSPYPQMQVRLGYRADTQTPSREVGSIDITSSESHLFEFRGRLEEFPVQSRTQSKYPGMLIWIRNSFSDGRPTPKPKQIVVENDDPKKRKKKKTVWEEDPDFPKIVIERVEFQAPVFLSWPPKHHQQIIARQPDSSEQEIQVAEDTLRRFMTRAFRRPVDDASVDTMLNYFTTIRPTARSFEQAIRETLTMVLVAPDFLYRVESPGTLNQFELASRLSYFLWNSMPDPRLYQLAEEGKLSDPQVLRDETRRMMHDERSWSFVREFSDQWLDLEGVHRVAINPNYYPDFDIGLKEQLRQESQHFFAEILRNDLSALNFLRSRFAMLNQPLAKHYGVSGPRGSEFERVDLSGTDRQGGLLTQGSVLLANSTGEDSHPIERGVWLRTALLNDPPSPPPPNVPNLDQEGVDAALMPLIQQLELHRENAACAHCHQRIDPWGIALEEFDAVGLVRDTVLRRSGRKEKRHPVESTTTLPDGKIVHNADELTTYLVEHQSDAFAKSLSSKLLTYALGRSLEISDRETVDKLTTQFVESDYRLPILIEAIVADNIFQQR